MPQLKGQVVIVTGASAGIGEGIVRRLAAAGAVVALNARRQDRLDALKAEIEKAGGKALAVTGDVTNSDDRKRLVDETMNSYKRIDALINNAGYGLRGPLELVDVDDVRRNFETNVFSLLALSQLVMPIMRRQGSGRIVNISSVAGKIARPLSSVYDSTKHALEALSDGMRGEMAPFGVQVVIVEPGFILTEFTEVADKVSASMTYQNTPYSPAYSPFSQGAGRLRKIAGKSDDIARVVERALTAGRPRIRYAAPKHAKVFIALKRFLPARLIDYIVARQTGMTEERLQATGSNPSRVSEGDLKSDGSS